MTDAELPEGAAVTVLLAEGDHTFDADEETERMLLESIAQCERGQTVRVYRHHVAAFDTTPAAAAVHEEAQRRVGASGRLRIALELSDLTHAFAVVGIRRRRPELTDDEARRELARLLYARE